MRYSEAGNIFSLDGLVQSQLEEHVDALFSNQQVQIKRIVSHGHTSPSGKWYDQPDDEWVVLLQGKASLEFEDGRLTHMKGGDYLKIEAHVRHRISYTSIDPPCIWLAVYIKTDNSIKT